MPTTHAEIQLTVETPTFLSAGAGTPAELRMPALRGAARYWFRALAAPVFTDDTAAIARAEAEVFGAAAGTGTGPSPVAFRPVKLPPAERNPSPGWLRIREPGVNGIGYLLGPGLYEPPSEPEGREHPGLKQPSHLAEDATGRFAVSVRAAAGLPTGYATELTGIALWAVGAFGGLGARTHRGFGGVRLDGLEQLSPVLAPGGPLDHGHPAIRRLHELVADRWHRAVPAERAPTVLGAAAPYPQAPSWSRWHLTQSTATFQSWVMALQAAGRALRGFRAPVDRQQPPHNMIGLPPYKRHVTHEYIDAIQPAMRGDIPVDDVFRIGAFGLPVVFGKYGTVNQRAADGAELRRASPLWICPQRRGNTVGLLYHVFEARLRPPGATLGFPRKGHPDVPLQLDEATAYRVIAGFLGTAP